jgi:hypothetical protein
MFDVEAAFLHTALDMQVFSEWPQRMLDLGFFHRGRQVKQADIVD